jgi:hypothetical protein
VGAANHLIIPLLGKFKGELSARYHLAPMAAETSSGLKPKLWVSRLIEVREQMGRVQGPAFCDACGEIARALVYEEAIITRLLAVQEKSPEVIAREVNLMEEFGISRSFRRGSTSTARSRGVEDKHVDLINRWRKFEQARGTYLGFEVRNGFGSVRRRHPHGRGWRWVGFLIGDLAYLHLGLANPWVDFRITLLLWMQELAGL